MPESFAAFAIVASSARLPADVPPGARLRQPTEQPPRQPPGQSLQQQQDAPAPPRTARGGRLRQAFENDLVLDYLDLAEALAARFEARGRERADLNQVAYLGLVKAARGFDRTKGHSFPAYAAPTITGELKRYLRDRSWMVRPPRHIQDLRSQLFRAEPELAQELGRNPTVPELAAHLEVGADAVREALNAASSLRPDSLDAVPPHEGALPVAEVLACPDMPLERLEELSCLRGAIQELDAADRELLYRRYFCEETQVELGRQLGMTQMQVSRRLARVLVDLQHRIQDSSLCTPDGPAAAGGAPATPARGRAGQGAAANGSPGHGSPRRNPSRFSAT